MWFIGVDVGGTFTDFYALNTSNGRVHMHKTPSTPDDPSIAILEGIEALRDLAEMQTRDIERLAHGTTVATNSLIQRKGAKVAVLTTEGFTDLLEIGRQIRPKMYDLKADYPPPLAERHMRFGVSERIGGKGQVRIELSEEAIRTAVKDVRASGASACAVCFLFSFLNPDHEKKIGRALAEELPHIHVSLSTMIQPEFREYERFSTTLLNAYLQPIIGDYMRSLGRRFEALAPKARLGINQSSGGLMSVARAGAVPIRTALSGPAAGVIGAVYQAKLAKRRDIITLDMGGTSADVSLIEGYEAGIRYDRTVADFPIRLPMVDIHTVGAGGGSDAWFDKDGLMKVGPLSAGAEPGPACYGRGGKKATVSDANLVLGRLPDSLIGGAMKLDINLARSAIKKAADKLQFPIERTAHGIIGIVVANMVRAIRTISVERGHDPRDFSLMAFGGAGPLHACDGARALDIREIVVPPAPGILCAQGLVVSDLKEDFVITRRLAYDGQSIEKIKEDLTDLLSRAASWFCEENINKQHQVVRIAFDMRYIRQNFELTVPWIEIEGEQTTPQMSSLENLRNRFYQLHELTYGHFTENDPIEIVNIRLTAIGRTKIISQEENTDVPQSQSSVVSDRFVWFGPQEPLKVPVHDRSLLYGGQKIVGPAVIEQLDAVTVIQPGDFGKVDGFGNLIISMGA